MSSARSTNEGGVGFSQVNASLWTPVTLPGMDRYR